MRFLSRATLGLQMRFVARRPEIQMRVQKSPATSYWCKSLENPLHRYNIDYQDFNPLHAFTLPATQPLHDALSAPNSDSFLGPNQSESRGARASRAPCLASRRTHLCPKVRRGTHRTATGTVALPETFWRKMAFAEHPGRPFHLHRSAG